MNQNRGGHTSTWKIVFGVALGILTAGAITGLVRMYIVGAMLSNMNDAMKQFSQVHSVSRPRQNQISSHTLASIPVAPSLLDIQSVPSVPIYEPPKSQREIVSENSQKAVVVARKDVADFKSQYKKPPECLDMQTSAIRMHCANAFIKARKDYEALNK